MDRKGQTELGKLELRLLELFAAIVRHGSVTDAAIELGIPQPTASRSLNRLREIFRDDLFVRAAHGVQPTAVATAVSGIVDEILLQGKLLANCHTQFDPRTARRTFVVSASEVSQNLILPLIYRAIEPYPKLSIRAVSVPEHDLIRALGNGDVDIAFGAHPRLQGAIIQRTIYREGYRVYCRPDHPFARKPVMETFLASRHLIVVGRTTAPAHHETEARLREILDPDHIKINAENFLVGLFMVAEAQLLLVAANHVMAPLARKLGLVGFDPPFALPKFAMKQFWHPRNHRDSAHQWLRTVLRDALVSDQKIAAEADT